MRRPRRKCPGVGGDICAVCCGTERENTVHCPLDCEFLVEARMRDKQPELDVENMPNKDVRVTDDFLRDESQLIGATMRAVVEAGLTIPGVVDHDLRDAFDSLTRTFRTLQSGLLYESKPANAVAARVHERVLDALEKYRREVAEQHGRVTVRDSSILGVLVFLQRAEWQFSNGRRLGRAFLDFLRRQPGIELPPETGAGSPSLLVP